MLTPQMRLARTLYGQWKLLDERPRARTAPIAREVKELALELRGRFDRQAAEAELAQANEALAIVIIDVVAGDPDEADIRRHIEHEFEHAALGAAEAA